MLRSKKTTDLHLKIHITHHMKACNIFQKFRSRKVNQVTWHGRHKAGTGDAVTIQDRTFRGWIYFHFDGW